ncbi:MAG: aminodeoxychorismate lyase [Nitrospirae bacterium]|nr:MAG: aminodeoxychorismate lyase [Nitrospirota bacterium]
MYIYLNGNIIREKDARISINDRGFLLGDGVFETLRAYNGKPFLVSEHLERLSRAAQKLRITLNESPLEMVSIVERLLEMNNLKEAYIRITLSRGTGGRGIEIDGCSEPTLLIITRAYEAPSEEIYKRGVRVGFLERKNTRLPEDYDIKSISFLNNILSRLEVSDRGLFEGILLNSDGFITEGTVSNLFFIKRGRLHTPSVESGILKGITRGKVLEIAKSMGIEVEEGLYRKEQLLEADEVFITNSLLEIVPVCEIESKGFKDITITRGLLKQYRKEVELY